MLLYLTIGIVLLMLFIIIRQCQLLNRYSKNAKQHISWISLIIGLLLSIFLLIAGKLNLIWATATAGLPWIARIINTWQFWQHINSFIFRRPNNQEQFSQSSKNKQYTDENMTVERAAEILGLELPTCREHIFRAHRQLMKRNHPDYGGSNYIAGLLNQAKQVLLKQKV